MIYECGNIKIIGGNNTNIIRNKEKNNIILRILNNKLKSINNKNIIDIKKQDKLLHMINTIKSDIRSEWILKIKVNEKLRKRIK